jgi:hypothetical protein
MEKHTHKGQLYVGRVSRGGAVPMYGSKIEHSTTIQIQLSTSREERKYGKEYYYGGERLVEIELTQAQFAEFVSSFNVGSGVPCTIRNINGQECDEPEKPDPINRIQKDIDNADSCYLERIDKISELLSTNEQNKKGLNLTETREILHEMKIIKLGLESDRKFYQRQARVEVDNMIVEAKATLEAHLTNRLTDLGAQALANQSLDAPQVPYLSDLQPGE